MGWEIYFWEIYFWEIYFWEIYFWKIYFWEIYFWKIYFWKIYFWNTLCLLKKKANTIRIYHLEIMKKKYPSNLKRCCENCCPLKKCTIEKNPNIGKRPTLKKKKSLQNSPPKKKKKKKKKK